MHHLVSGISFLCLFVNLILAPVPPFPTHLFLHPSLLPLLIHHFVHLQLHLSFTPGLKLTSFTNPTPRSFTSSFRTASTDFCLYRFFWAFRLCRSVIRLCFTFCGLKPRPHLQQCRSKFKQQATLSKQRSTLSKHHSTLLLGTMSNEFIVKFRPFDKVETNWKRSIK